MIDLVQDADGTLTIAEKKKDGVENLVEQIKGLIKESKSNSDTKEQEKITFDYLPATVHFKKWYTNAKRKTAMASGKPDEALEWIGKVEKATSWEQLGDEFSSEFSSLQMKITNLLYIVQESHRFQV